MTGTLNLAMTEAGAEQRDREHVGAERGEGGTQRDKDKEHEHDSSRI